MAQPSQKQGAVVRIDPRFSALAKRLHTEARKGPAAFSRFTESAEFKRRFDELAPPYWRRVMQAVQDTEKLAHKRDPLPPPARPLPHRGAGKWGRWKDPAEVARLRAAFVQAGPGEGQAERAARILGMTTPATKLAYKRHVLDAATNARAA